jgi:hypothetical protein
MFNHSGSTFGYKSYVTAYRDRGQGVVVMANGDNGLALIMEVVRAVAKVYGWPDTFVQKTGLVVVPLVILQSYVGIYTATFEGHPLQLEIYLDGNIPMIKTALMGTGNRSDLYPTAMDTFLLKEDTIVPGTITFLKDGSDKVTSLTITLLEGGTIVAAKIL